MQRLDGHWIAKRVGILEHYKSMTLAEIALFDAYLLLANKQTGECWRSIRQLEGMLPMKKDTIIRAKKALIERGWIQKVGQTGVFIPKLYRYSEVVGNGEQKVGNIDFSSRTGKRQKSHLGEQKVENIDQVVGNGEQKVAFGGTIIEEGIIIEDDNILCMSKNPENSELCKLELRYLHLLKSIPNYTFNFEKDLSFIRDLLTDFPELDILKEIRNWKTWLLDKNLKGKINYRSRLRRWLQNSIRYTEEKAHEKRGYNSGQSEAYGKKRGVVGHPGRKGFDLPSDYPIDAGDESAGEDQDA